MNIPLINAADLSPEWLEDRRAVIARDGYAIREGSKCTIKIKSLKTNRWLLLPLAVGTVSFTNPEERAKVMAQLLSKTPIPVPVKPAA